MDWLAAIFSVTGLYLAGSKNRICFMIGFINQFVFLYIDIKMKLWGLVPLCFIYMGLCVRNYLRWRRDDLARLGTSSEESDAEENQAQA